MLDCFNGLVSLPRTCGNPTAGVMSLGNLGIDQTLLGKFTGAEDTVASMLADCEAWARATMHNDVLSYVGKQTIAKTILDSWAVGNGDDEEDPITDTGIGGFMVEIMVPQSNMKLTIGSLGLFATTTGTVIIRVYDLEDGKEVATYDLDAVDGEIVQDDVQIMLPASRRIKRYFITHNLTTFYRTDITGCGGCSNTYSHGGVHVSGARMASDVPKRKSNIRYVNHSSGILAVISVSCDHGRMLCEIKDQLAYPYTLKVAEAIMHWGFKATGRLNDATINREQLLKDADRFGAQYAASMQNVTGRMSIPKDHLCFNCNTPIRSVITLP